MRQVIVMKVELEWIVLQPPFPVTPWNCNKSRLEALVEGACSQLKIRMRLYKNTGIIIKVIPKTNYH